MQQKHFGWIVSWRITDKCNLKCKYCDLADNLPAFSKENINYARIISELSSIKPRVVNISGGEPTLVPELPDIVRKIKSTWNPFIRIVHNGTNLKKASSVFPFIDRLVISLDGAGAVNSLNRGIDGDKVISDVGAVMDKASQHNVNVAFNCVVTTKNVSGIRELAEKIRSTSTDILLSLMPVLPADGEISIINKPEIMQKFLDDYQSLRKEGFRVAHIFDPVLRHQNWKRIDCYNQFFILRVNTAGMITSCAMNSLNMPVLTKGIGWLFSKNGIKRKADRLRKFVSNGLLNKTDFGCSTMCNCEGWLDLLFLGKESDSLPVYTPVLKGRLSEEDYRNVDKFVRKHINPSFDIEWFRNKIES